MDPPPLLKRSILYREWWIISSAFALLHYGSIARKTLLLCSVLCQLAWLCCVYTYTCAVCVPDNESAIVEPTQPTDLRCNHPQCFILEKLNPPDLVQEKKIELRILNLCGSDKKFPFNYLLIGLLCSYARRHLLCLKLCQHNLPMPNHWQLGDIAF